MFISWKISLKQHLSLESFSIAVFNVVGFFFKQCQIEQSMKMLFSKLQTSLNVS